MTVPNLTAPEVARAQAPANGRLPLAQWLLLILGFVAFYALYFSPVLLRQGVLAPGDGETFFLPFFHLPAFEFWTDLILSGYPVVSDSQAQMLYPLRWLSPTFNVLVVAAYVVSAVGMFGLALKLTGSRIGAMASALVVSGSGFMVAHLGHLSVIHAAAWIPSILWALACLRHNPRWLPVAAGAVAVAFSILGGHPQVSIIGLLLAGCFGMHEVAAVAASRGGRAGLHTLARVFVLFTLGLALAAPSLNALADAATTGLRGAWSPQDFNSFSHDWASLRLLAFPNLYGGYSPGPFGGYVGPWNATELATYAGILPWFLALAALLGWRANRSHLFWFGAIAIAIFLALGTTTPIGDLVYQLPILGRFRAQARFSIVVIIALAVLSAFGTASLLRSQWPRRRIGWLILAALILSAIAVVSVWLAPPSSLIAAKKWAHPALSIPILLIVLSLLLLIALVRWPGYGTTFLMLGLLVVDLGTFGWFYEWRYRVATATPPPLPATTRRLLELIAEGDGRALPLGAGTMPTTIPFRPNVNIRYGIPSMVGYGPLLPVRYAIYAGVDVNGDFAPIAPSAPLMDVLAVRWFVGPIENFEPLTLGSGCGGYRSPRRARVRLPDGATGVLRVVTNTACSTTLPNAQTLAEVRVLADDGSVVGSHPLRAGLETAEWAYDREDLRGHIAHARASVAETYEDVGFRGLWFEAKLPLSLEKGMGATVEFSLIDSASTLLRIKSVDFEDGVTGQRTQLPLSAIYLGDGDQLTPELFLPGLPVAERRAYRGMAWGVCRARAVEPSELPPILTSGIDSSGRRFDALEEALVETGFTVPNLACSSAPRVEVVRRKNGNWLLRSTASGDGLLVVSQSYDRGWSARVDGIDVPVIPVDGLVLGILVPSGRHEVEISYLPAGFRLSLLFVFVSLLTCVALAVSPWLARVRKYKK